MKPVVGQWFRTKSGHEVLIEAQLPTTGHFLAKHRCKVTWTYTDKGRLVDAKTDLHDLVKKIK